ncbi:GNAT family N-acetyltransferase [Clostridium taeniosporum]|uniref:N-acetyltransferase n=1 Tax=Clostridium taeniosporum TaxID=394958 RepID=A0A1D7XI74_9CLOT|nr:GNAT family N-acetyltransferase [Clostridium taeniosporum]AOR23043.1 N-acetyltransferase [Clostridium taeniosporum]
MRKEHELYRRNGKLVYIKQPEYKELAFIAKLWNDEETMKDIGGVYKFTENKWESFYKKMVSPTDGRNFYCLIYTAKDEPIGEVSFHGYDPITKIARSNIKIYYRYRNMGYGKEAMRLMLEYYFIDFEGKMILDKVSNENSKGFANKLGFKKSGTYQNETTFKLTKKDFFCFKDSNIKNVSFIIYDNINMVNYTLFWEIFNEANKLSNKKIFNFNIISLTEKVKYNNNLKLEVNSSNFNVSTSNIIILPDSTTIENILKNENAIKIILEAYNQCDYICAIGSSVAILEYMKSLTGISIPNIENLSTLINSNRLNRIKVTNENFVDNGRVMIASNLMGTIEMILSIIFKISGKDLVRKLEKKLGINIT